MVIKVKTLQGNKIFLLPFQQKIVNDCYDENGNIYKTIIICSPTNSGKTPIFYTLINNNIQKYDNIYYTSPLKFLSKEKFSELELNFPNNVNIITGDIKNFYLSKKITCCTQEIFDSMFAEKIENSLIIIDEIHYVFSNHDRARSYVGSFAKINESNTLILMSATIASIDEFSDYIENISYKRHDIKIIQNEERLTPLKYSKKGIKFKNIRNSILFSFSRQHIDTLTEYLLPDRDIKKDYEIKEIEDICNEYKCKCENEFKFGLAKFHGKILPKQKLLIEKLHRNGYIDTIIGTNALALGCNLNVESAIFSSCKYVLNNELLKPSEFFQLAGRAGRYGYYDKGIVTYLSDKILDPKYLEELKEDYLKLIDMPLESPNIEVYPDIQQILLSNEYILSEIDEMIRLKYPRILDNNMINSLKVKYRKDINKELLKYKDYNNLVEEFNGKSFRDIWQKILKQVYLPEFSIEQNCNLVYYYCMNTQRRNYVTVSEFADYDINYNLKDKTDGCILYEMLLIKKMCNKFLKIDDNSFVNYDEFNEKINDIDHTVLNII
jgi:superfamily II helicase